MIWVVMSEGGVERFAIQESRSDYEKVPISYVGPVPFGAIGLALLLLAFFL